MQKPTGNSRAPRRALPVLTVMVTAKAAASASIAPPAKARMRVSLVDIKTLASPASIILEASSGGLTYAIGDCLSGGCSSFRVMQRACQGLGGGGSVQGKVMG